MSCDPLIVMVYLFFPPNKIILFLFHFLEVHLFYLTGVIFNLICGGLFNLPSAEPHQMMGQYPVEKIMQRVWIVKIDWEYDVLLSNKWINYHRILYIPYFSN